MKDFLILFSIYRAITRRSIGAFIYMSATYWKIPLWISSFSVVVLGVLVWRSEPWQPGFAVFLGAFSVWALIFDRARRNALRELYILFPEEMKHYAPNYEFVRYRKFLHALQQLPRINRDNIQRALLYLETDLETQPMWSSSSHPLIVGLLGAFFAILGGAAGRWDWKYLVISLFSLTAAMYFCYMVLGLVRTRKSDLLEFKRFLIWTLNDMTPLGSTQAISPVEVSINVQ